MTRTTSRFSRCARVSACALALTIATTDAAVAETITLQSSSTYVTRDEEFSPYSSNAWWPYPVYQQLTHLSYTPSDNSPYPILRDSSYNFNQFDPSLGTLNSVSVAFSSSIDMDYWVGLGSSGVLGTYYFGATQAFYGPGVTITAPAAFGLSQSGTIYYANGGPFLVKLGSTATSGTVPYTTSDKSAYVGSGTVQLGVKTGSFFHADSNYYDGAYQAYDPGTPPRYRDAHNYIANEYFGSLGMLLNGRGSDSVSVNYDYTPNYRYTWTGNGANDNWTSPSNWGGPLVVPLSNQDTAIIFAGSNQLVAPYQDINGSIQLNALMFENAAGAFHLNGGSLDFRQNSSGAMPIITQNSSSLIQIDNSLVLNNSTTYQGDGSLLLTGNITGPGSFTKSGAGTLSMTGGGTLGGDFIVNTGVLRVVGGSALNATGNLSVSQGVIYVFEASSINVASSTVQVGKGSDNNAMLEIYNRSKLTSFNGDIGSDNGSTGRVLVHDSNSFWNNFGTISVGNRGTGTLGIQNGASVSSDNANIGAFAGSTGSVLVSDAYSTWVNVTSMAVGNSGNGVLKISNGASVSNSGLLSIANDTSGNGTLTVTDTSSALTVGGSLFVGSYGTGTLGIQNGASVSSDNANIGAFAGSTGSVLVSDAYSTWVNVTSMAVGNSGNGVLKISNGASVSNSGLLSIANDTSGNGTLTVTDTSSALTVGGSLFVGSYGTGSLNIQNSARVISNNGLIGVNSGSTGIVIVSGTESTWAISGSVYLGGDSLTAGGSGAVSVGGGGKVTVGNKLKLWDSGTVNLDSGGTLQTVNADLRKGTFNFNGGTLAISGALTLPSGATLTVPTDGTFANNGTITSPVVALPGSFVKGGGIFADLALHGGNASPGNSPGTMTSSTTNWGTGSYVWEINKLDDGVGPSEQGNNPGWDVWNAGTLSIGPTFSIELHSLTLANTDGALDNWDANKNYQWLIATSNNFEFNDLSVLENLNSNLDPTAFAAFNSLSGGHFDLIGSAGGNNLVLEYNAVPEPSSMVLAGMGLIGLLALMRRSRKRGVK